VGERKRYGSDGHPLEDGVETCVEMCVEVERRACLRTKRESELSLPTQPAWPDPEVRGPTGITTEPRFGRERSRGANGDGDAS